MPNPRILLALGSMDIELKPITHEDEPYVWCVYEGAMRSLIEKVWGWDSEWQVRNFKTQMEKSQTYLALYNSKQIGYVQIEIKDEYTFVNMIALEPEYRSRRIGPKVIKEIEKQRQGIPIKLKCLTANDAAYRFYLNNGFKLIGQDDVFYTLQLGNKWGR